MTAQPTRQAGHEPRADYRALAPDALRALRALDESLKGTPLGTPLALLVQLRVSQVNRCAFCCGLHAEQARRAGETQQRLDVLAAWEESPLFGARERAALAWAEAIARLDGGGADDALYRACREHLTERELVDLTFVVGAVGVWNRLAVAFGTARRPGVAGRRTASGTGQGREVAHGER